MQALGQCSGPQHDKKYKQTRECSTLLRRASHFEPLFSLAASFLEACAAFIGTLAPFLTMAKSSRERAWWGRTAVTIQLAPPPCTSAGYPSRVARTTVLAHALDEGVHARVISAELQR